MTDDPASAIRRAAWDAIVRGLDALVDAPELTGFEARGAEFFVWELKRICEDIGAHVETGTFEEAMEKLIAGFGRATGKQPHALGNTFKLMARQAWTDDRRGRSKAQFAKDFASVLQDESNYIVSTKTIKDVWLRGLPV